jgi:hypothetical protein
MPVLSDSDSLPPRHASDASSVTNLPPEELSSPGPAHESNETVPEVITTPKAPDDSVVLAQMGLPPMLKDIVTSIINKMNAAFHESHESFMHDIASQRKPLESPDSSS